MIHCDKSFLSLCSLIPPPSCSLPPSSPAQSVDFNPIMADIYCPFTMRHTLFQEIYMYSLNSHNHPRKWIPLPLFKAVSFKSSLLYLLGTRWSPDAALWSHRGFPWPQRGLWGSREVCTGATMPQWPRELSGVEWWRPQASEPGANAVIDSHAFQDDFQSPGSASLCLRAFVPQTTGGHPAPGSSPHT